MGEALHDFSILEIFTNQRVALFEIITIPFDPDKLSFPSIGRTGACTPELVINNQNANNGFWARSGVSRENFGHLFHRSKRGNSYVLRHSHFSGHVLQAVNNVGQRDFFHVLAQQFFRCRDE